MKIHQLKNNKPTSHGCSLVLPTCDKMTLGSVTFKNTVSDPQ